MAASYLAARVGDVIVRSDIAFEGVSADKLNKQRLVGKVYLGGVLMAALTL